MQWVCRRSGGAKGAQYEKGIMISSRGKEMIIINWEQVFLYIVEYYQQ